MDKISPLISILLGVLSIGLVGVNGLIPYVWLAQHTNPYIYSLLSGADPIITAYLENAVVTVPILVMVMILFGTAAIRFFQRRAVAAKLVIAACALIVVSLAIADHRGLTALHFNPGELPLLITAMTLFIILSFWASRDHTDMT